MSDKPKGAKPAVSDDVKAKFREALARKHGHGGRDVGDHADRSKVDHAHGAETSAREQMFRRKSG